MIVDIETGCSRLTATQRGCQLECPQRCLLCQTASLSLRCVDKTIFRTSPLLGTRRLYVVRPLPYFLASAIEARVQSQQILMVTTWWGVK